MPAVPCAGSGSTGRRPDELSLSEIREIVRDTLFSRVEYLGISGGEPFLRNDLLEILDVFIGRCPGLKRVSMTTNGLPTRQIEAQVGRLAETCQARSILLDVSVSCHALDPLADQIYGVKDAFQKISRSLGLLKAYRETGKLSLSINCVLLRHNLEQARELLTWARKEEIPASFVVGEQRSRFQNLEMGEVFITDGQRRRLLDFLEHLRASQGRSPGGLKYRALQDVLQGADRPVSCYYALAGLLLGFDGALYYCSHSRAIGNCRERPAADIFYDPSNLEYRKSQLLGAACRQCPPYTATRLELEKDIFRAIWYVLRS